MAFENVDVGSLRNALHSCKNSINHSTTDDLIGSLPNSNIWESAAKKNLLSALNKLSNTHYKELENLLDKYTSLVNSIEEYQNLDKETVSLEKSYDSLSKNMMKTEEVVSTTKDKDGKAITEKETRTVKDEKVANEMSQMKTKIDENKSRMSRLESKIKSSM